MKGGTSTDPNRRFLHKKCHIRNKMDVVIVDLSSDIYVCLSLPLPRKLSNSRTRNRTSVVLVKEVKVSEIKVIVEHRPPRVTISRKTNKIKNKDGNV